MLLTTTITTTMLYEVIKRQHQQNYDLQNDNWKTTTIGASLYRVYGAFAFRRCA